MSAAPALVAPDKFKGTFAASQVAASIAAGLREAGREAIELPAADGGDGTMSALLGVLEGELRTATVSDPLGRPIEASYAMLADGRAIVEAAQASGLERVAEDDRDPVAATTRGTGELIALAAGQGPAEILVASGGTAATDGGAGAVEALGEAGVRPRLTVVCDVRTPWEDAARVFGPQKGATADDVKRLTRRLATLARSASRDPRGVPMTGSGGGLAGGLWAHLKARLVPGAPFVLDALGFDALMRGAAFVVTGEGRLDSQTLRGKAVGEIATRCRQGGVWCHAVVGQNRLSPFEVRLLDFASVSEAGDERAMREAGRAIGSATAEGAA